MYNLQCLISDKGQLKLLLKALVIGPLAARLESFDPGAYCFYRSDEEILVGMSYVPMDVPSRQDIVASLRYPSWYAQWFLFRNVRSRLAQRSEDNVLTGLDDISAFGKVE